MLIEGGLSFSVGAAKKGKFGYVTFRENTNHLRATKPLLSVPGRQARALKGGCMSLLQKCGSGHSQIIPLDKQNCSKCLIKEADSIHENEEIISILFVLVRLYVDSLVIPSSQY